jgi:hypothetical protein
MAQAPGEYGSALELRRYVGLAESGGDGTLVRGQLGESHVAVLTQAERMQCARECRLADCLHLHAHTRRATHVMSHAALQCVQPTRRGPRRCYSAGSAPHE